MSLKKGGEGRVGSQVSPTRESVRPHGTHPLRVHRAENHLGARSRKTIPIIRRGTVVGTAMVGLTGAAIGCSPSSPNPESTYSASAPSPETTTPALPNVNIGGLPDRLPSAVKRVVNTAVSVEYQYLKPIGRSGSATEFEVTSDTASGVRVAPDTYLSAGHFVKDGKNVYLRGINQCGNITVMGPSNQPTALESVGNRVVDVYGSDLPATRLIGSYIEGDGGSVPDVSLLHAPDVQHTLPGQPTDPIASATPKIGQAVYFVNYEPTSKGVSRSPSEIEEQNLNDTNTTGPHLTEPAVYGGVVVGKQLNGDLIVADGLASYDALGDKETLRGASGGEVENSQGQLIGIAVEATEVDQSMTPAEFGSVVGANLTGVPSDTLLNEAIIQPVTTTMVASLERKVAQAPTCHYVPNS
jgi:hypothetical protein